MHDHDDTNPAPLLKSTTHEPRPFRASDGAAFLPLRLITFLFFESAILAMVERASERREWTVDQLPRGAPIFNLHDRSF
jgi:hypothetical protein